MRKLFLSAGSFLLLSMIATAQDTGIRYIDSASQFIPATLGPYCPTKLLGGDREFGGHGPEIWASTKLRIEGNSIYADVYMHARETQSDWSETEGTWTKLVYTAPRGYEITGITSGVSSEVHYISKPGPNAFSPAGVIQAMTGGARGSDVPFKDDGLVARWNIVGDTGGDDISNDDNCNDDTQVAVQLNPVKVKLRRAVPVSKAVNISSKTLVNTKGIVSPRLGAITPDSVVQYIPATIGPYCPTKLLGGDREFGGHGPEIWASIKLRVVNGNTIYADVYMHARETQSDWSETEGTWSKLIYTAPRGYEITGITTGINSEVHYISKPGANAFSPAGVLQAMTGGAKGTDVPFKDDGLVARWNIVGDTGGDDISTDDNCNDDTQVAVQLNPMKIKLRRK